MASITRRLAAILAADVAGYSRLTGADEEGTLAELKAIRRELGDPKVKEHRGRIVKTTGDGLLIEFASVVDAVRCAVEVQQAMAERNAHVPERRRIEFRMGINLGDIIRDGRDIYGDGVNIAARLEALAEPGAVFVSNNVYEHVRDRLSVAFEDLGEQQVKNIARPVHVYRVRPEGVIPTVPSAVELALPDKPSIAVLPFTNMSADPDQEFLADGIAEDVITALSRYPSLFVIARNSSFTYKGRAVDVKTVGHELGVRYVLEGSLRKAGNRIRVTTQLVEAEAGKHVWAERYDRDVSDIFAVQDEITEAVTVAIAPVVAEAERQRAIRKPPGSLDAWAAYQRGLWHLIKCSRDDCALAEKFFQQATALDPAFSGGYAGLALVQIQAGTVFATRPLPEAQNLAEIMAKRAVALDGADAEARSALGYALLARGDHEGSLAEVEEALAISPNLARAHGAFGTALILSGRLKEGLAALERYTRLDPRDPGFAPGSHHTAMGLYLSGEYEAAILAAKRAIRTYPGLPNAYRWLAAALGQAGRLDEARDALEQAISLSPAAFDIFVRRRVPWILPEHHSHMLEGLRKAGWSE